MEKKATDRNIYVVGWVDRAKHVSEGDLYVVQGIFSHRIMIRSGIVWAVRYCEVSGITGSVTAGVDCIQELFMWQKGAGGIEGLRKFSRWEYPSISKKTDST